MLPAQGRAEGLVPKRLICSSAPWAGHARPLHGARQGSATRRKLRADGEEITIADLAPVPLDQNVAAVSVNPVMGYPVGTHPWWLFPPSLDPNVMSAIPIVISLNPHMVAARPRAPPLDHHARWRDANHNLACHSAEGQRACKNQSDHSLKNHRGHSPSFRNARAWPCATT